MVGTSAIVAFLRAKAIERRGAMRGRCGRSWGFATSGLDLVAVGDEAALARRSGGLDLSKRRSGWTPLAKRCRHSSRARGRGTMSRHG